MSVIARSQELPVEPSRKGVSRESLRRWGSWPPV